MHVPTHLSSSAAPTPFSTECSFHQSGVGFFSHQDSCLDLIVPYRQQASTCIFPEAGIPQKHRVGTPQRGTWHVVPFRCSDAIPTRPWCSASWARHFLLRDSVERETWKHLWSTFNFNIKHRGTIHILCANKSSTPQSQCKQRRRFVKKKS